MLPPLPSGASHPPMRIKSATFETSAPTLADCPEVTMPECALIGRSNVGKSSLLNMLTGKKDLAKVSATPGHTKMINYFIINQQWRLVDLPGYGFAKVKKDQRDFFHDVIAEYISAREGLACTYVILDATLPPQRIDLEFVHWLCQLRLPFALVFNKIDRGKPNAIKKNVEAFQQEMANFTTIQPQTFTVSAKTGSGAGLLIASMQRL
jgi:GTP-binding protein